DSTVVGAEPAAVIDGLDEGRRSGDRGVGTGIAAQHQAHDVGTVGGRPSILDLKADTKAITTRQADIGVLSSEPRRYATLRCRIVDANAETILNGGNRHGLGQGDDQR